MFYEIEEALQREDLDLLDAKQKNDLLDMVKLYNQVKEAIFCSDISAGFPDEDELSEPERLISKARNSLVNGNKAERENVVQALIEAVSEWSLRTINSAEYGRSELFKLQSIFPVVPMDNPVYVPTAVRVARQKMK